MRNPLKNIEPKRIIKESMERDRKLEIAEHKPKIKDEKTELQASLAENHCLGRFHHLAQPLVEQQFQSLVLRSMA